MAVELTFSGGAKVSITGYEPADLAKEFSTGARAASWSGGFLYLQQKGGGDLWVNPATVAFLKREPD